MNANITLNSYASTETLHDSSLPFFSNLILKCARSKLFHFSAGHLLVQNIFHHLVNVDLFQYSIDLNTEVNATVKKPSVVMVAMLNGHSILYDESRRIVKESYGNCCYLSYMPPGDYTRTFLTGTHQILLLTISVDFLVKQQTKYREVSPVLDSYYSASNEYKALSDVPMARGAFRLLHKLNSCRNFNQKTVDSKVKYFLNDCLDTYNKRLEHNDIQDAMAREKADEIADFLLRNYHNEIVNDRAKLAAYFCVSEATMLRLAKKRFGKSLRQHVVELRMLYGLKQLMTSARSIREIAESVGYVDPFHFSRAFKQHFNISPSQIDNLKLP